MFVVRSLDFVGLRATFVGLGVKEGVLLAKFQVVRLLRRLPVRELWDITNYGKLVHTSKLTII